MDDIDIYRSAKLLIDQHGAEATRMEDRAKVIRAKHAKENPTN